MKPNPNHHGRKERRVGTRENPSASTNERSQFQDRDQRSETGEQKDQPQRKAVNARFKVGETDQESCGSYTHHIHAFSLLLRDGRTTAFVAHQVQSVHLIGEHRDTHNYSVAGSFSITTFRCAVTSLWSFTGTVNSPKVFSGSCSWILRRSMLKPFLVSESPRSLEVTEPNS